MRAGEAAPTAELPAVRLTVAADRDYRLAVVQAGLACCALEFEAALPRAAAVPDTASGEQVHVLVVSGTVTDRLAPVVRRLYDALPPPAYVLSFGACSNSGGPYWDSYSVTKGVDRLLPVDVYVPGCPPRPEALLEGLAQLGRTVGRDRGGR